MLLDSHHTNSLCPPIFNPAVVDEPSLASMTSKNMTSAGSGPSTQPKGAGKKRKRFLEHQDSVGLALSVANAQEDKTAERLERHRHGKDGETPSADSKKRPSGKSASKLKLKETKATIAADRARHKKERVQKKKRKDGAQVQANSRDNDGSAAVDKGKRETRKRVSFV